MKGEERERGFTVKDRRRFSADGEVRDEAPNPAPAPDAPAADSAAPPHADHPHHHDHDHHDHDHGHDHTHPHAEISFATFVISLSAQALALLGEIPDPVDRTTQVDLEGARQIIDILGILSEKTRGNLDAAESSLLDNALFDLRMKYVDRAQGR